MIIYFSRFKADELVFNVGPYSRIRTYFAGRKCTTPVVVRVVAR